MSQVKLNKSQKAALAILVERPNDGVTIHRSTIESLKAIGFLDEDGTASEEGVTWHNKPKPGRPGTGRVQGSITLPPKLWTWVDNQRGANELGRGGQTRADFIETALLSFKDQLEWQS